MSSYISNLATEKKYLLRILSVKNNGGMDKIVNNNLLSLNFKCCFTYEYTFTVSHPYQKN